jgi:cytochrome c5
MFKRVTIVALVVAAFVLMMAVPALAFNGYRGDYTVSSACRSCHDNGSFGAPKVGANWAKTAHGVDAEASSAALSLPYGSVCAGCHTANYAPAKATPLAVSTSTASAVAWVADPSTTTAPQGLGNAPMSEMDIGCSSCHYGAGAGISTVDGRDVNDTAHTSPYGNLADPQICGACHSRYSYTTPVYTVTPVPYLKVTGGSLSPSPNPTTIVDGTPTPLPAASQTTLIQPQMAIGYPMLGSPSPAPAWSPNLAAYLTVQTPGWTPAPMPTVTPTGFAKLQTYWKIDGKDSVWQQSGHDGSAAQYPEWASEGLTYGHSNALTALTSESFWAFLPEASKQECLECHSADFRINKEAGKSPTSASAKYGITCVGCHAPHDAGTVKGVWDEEFDAQLVDDANLAGNGSNLCTECHNGEIPAGSTASPGAEVHHPMKELMDGYGAIDVQSFPSVHKGKCIQCHMAPTSYSRGAVQLGGNHTFNIITPDEANEATPVPILTTSATVAGTPKVVTNTVTYDVMPYSACSTCHSRTTQLSPKPTATATAVDSPSAGTNTVTISQIAAGAQVYSSTTNTWTPGGDRAQWLQDTIDQRQAWTTAKIADIHAELKTAAQYLGYADEAAAQEALVAIAEADRTFEQTNFLKAFTNLGYVESEGSFGIHNWDYSRAIVNVALAEAKAAQVAPTPRKWVVTLKASKKSVKVNQKVKIRGLVLDGWGLAGKGKLTIQRKLGKHGWKKWTTVKLKSGGVYGKTMKMTQKGTWKIRGYMPGDGNLNLAAYSVYTTVKVKK